MVLGVCRRRLFRGTLRESGCSEGVIPRFCDNDLEIRQISNLERNGRANDAAVKLSSTREYLEHGNINSLFKEPTNQQTALLTKRSSSLQSSSSMSQSFIGGGYISHCTLQRLHGRMCKCWEEKCSWNTFEIHSMGLWLLSNEFNTTSSENVYVLYRKNIKDGGRILEPENEMKLRRMWVMNSNERLAY